MTQLPALPLAARLAAALPPGRFERLGVAVSGGGDSIALMHLLAEHRAAGGPEPVVVSLDHGLRPEAAAEVAGVMRAAAALGLAHWALVWRGWDGHGNLMQAARRARYRLIADWARDEGLPAVALGHTADDQAETFFMRLARGAGVDGLSGMAAERVAEGMLWLRPLLASTRAELRSWLGARGIPWVDDPSNENAAYERIRARAALAALAPLGITATGVAEVTQHLREVRAALVVQTHAAAAALARVEAVEVLIDRAGLEALPAEVRRRLLAHALRWIAGSEYAPRGPALAGFAEAVGAGTTATLHGCLALPEGPLLRLCREASAASGAVPPGALWDGRWRITGPDAPGCEVRALGEAGLRLCPDWRASGRPRAALAADPALWRGPDLVAAPLAGFANGWRAEPARNGDDFLASLFVH
ncbi:tRNA lysidine(34) synthetase TilS [Phaeovulum sp.]|uniref:tRNA lysidine(34) synthetase TilS n=1 Tax=Phaeovulum sp. TaxID=2934796 RepID=UPI002730C5A9|nr:tRNA lysidine(34) synthetase TilS [Phaeovulum sp.]MDP1667489.1 tRNA lysidine(34) synthetase TilS [Phaeovulum sp.]MDZ4120006.1 tRNA lysidine(34) synthetase TilS [Phaeovulum sp.]